jgi:ribonucleoside-diphosphate reductase alpha chain
LKNKYDLAWNQKSPIGYLKIGAITNKYLDQSGSWNTTYNPEFYPNEEIPLSELTHHILLAYKWGYKTLYYNNTYDGAGEVVDKSPEPDHSIDTEDMEECSGCVI